MDELWRSFADLIGSDAGPRNAGEMALRAIVVYIGALIMVRVGASRAFSRNTALDIVMGIVFGATLSRAINGDAPLVPTLAAGATLVLLHWLLSYLAVRDRRMGLLFKGEEQVLVRNGEIQLSAMRKAHISKTELIADLRLQVHTDDLGCVREANLESGGNVSFILRDTGESPSPKGCGMPGVSPGEGE